MAKPELGTKRVCVSCGTHFYDLGKTPAVCPKCGTEQPADQPRLRRPGRQRDRRQATEEARSRRPALEDADVEVEVAGDEAEEDVLEDTADLEDDADAIGPEIEVEPDSDEAER